LSSIKEKKKVEPFFYLAAVVLFNPFSEFHFTKNTWQAIDVILLTVCIVSLANDFRKSILPKSIE
jgi:hypothetical protein